MQIISNWNDMERRERRKLLTRPAAKTEISKFETAQKIIEKVREFGDSQLRALSQQFDNVTLETFKVTSEEFDEASTKISSDVDKALRKAGENIKAFHTAQKPSDTFLEINPGIKCWRRFLPLERVGLYAPAGTAPLPSTVLMLAIPAFVAGVEERILVTPPRRDGSADPGILHAAKIANVTSVYKIGGAQAIAALAFGTESIPKVDKIFGPGNAYVTAAKLLVAKEGVPCDLPAGPSELMVIADALSDPEIVAADLLSQAEHDIESDLILVTNHPDLAEKTKKEILNQLENLPRKDIARKSLANARIIVVIDLNEAITIANEYAPEHLIINTDTKTANSLASKVRHAGSVFIGPWSPEAAGDYATGTNHVLPTYGFARAYSGVTLESFLKSISFQELSASGLNDLAKTIETLADLEGLTAHRDAVARRRQKLGRAPC